MKKYIRSRSNEKLIILRTSDNNKVRREKILAEQYNNALAQLKQCNNEGQSPKQFDIWFKSHADYLVSMEIGFDSVDEVYRHYLQNVKFLREYNSYIGHLCELIRDTAKRKTEEVIAQVNAFKLKQISREHR